MNRNDFYMNLCYQLAENSKDRRTKLGSVIVSNDGDIKSMGWNSFPRGINDDIEARQDKDAKQYWFVHAEMNAILNAGRNGVSLKGCNLYCSAFPCHNCAHAIIQAGIKSVFYDVILDGWALSAFNSKTMFDEAGVFYKHLPIHKIDIKRRISGKTEDL